MCPEVHISATTHPFVKKIRRLKIIKSGTCALLIKYLQRLTDLKISKFWVHKVRKCVPFVELIQELLLLQDIESWFVRMQHLNQKLISQLLSALNLDVPMLSCSILKFHEYLNIMCAARYWWTWSIMLSIYLDQPVFHKFWWWLKVTARLESSENSPKTRLEFDYFDLPAK